jgi:short-subunit dehydrogenase
LASPSARHGVQVQAIDADLAQETSLEAIDAATVDLEVGLLVASAGFGSSGPFLEADLASDTEMLMVNGRCCRPATTSAAAFQGMPYAAHYAATKTYVQSLAEALQVELQGDGVAVLAAAPGSTHSGLAARAGMRLGAAMDPEAFAQPILDAVGYQATIVPGFLSRFLSSSLVPLPRWVRVRITVKVMQGMAIR